LSLPTAVVPWESDPISCSLMSTVNFSSRATYRHCAARLHYPEYSKSPPIRVWEMDLVLTKSDGDQLQRQVVTDLEERDCVGAAVGLKYSTTPDSEGKNFFIFSITFYYYESYLRWALFHLIWAIHCLYGCHISFPFSD
jgi:hypothetical protein